MALPRTIKKTKFLYVCVFVCLSVCVVSVWHYRSQWDNGCTSTDHKSCWHERPTWSYGRCNKSQWWANHGWWSGQWLSLSVNLSYTVRCLSSLLLTLNSLIIWFLCLCYWKPLSVSEFVSLCIPKTLWTKPMKGILPNFGDRCVWVHRCAECLRRLCSRACTSVQVCSACTSKVIGQGHSRHWPKTSWTPYLKNQWREFHPIFVKDVFEFVDVLIRKKTGKWNIFVTIWANFIKIRSHEPGDTLGSKGDGHSRRRYNCRLQCVELHAVCTVYWRSSAVCRALVVLWRCWWETQFVLIWCRHWRSVDKDKRLL